MRDLHDFLAAHFHQDWRLDAQDDREVVAAYRHRATAAERARVRGDIERLLARRLGDDALKKVLFEELHCYLCPSGEGESWLRELADALR